MITALHYLLSFLSGVAAAWLISSVKSVRMPKSDVNADFEAILKY